MSEDRFTQAFIKIKKHQRLEMNDWADLLLLNPVTATRIISEVGKVPLPYAFDLYVGIIRKAILPPSG